MTIGRASQEIKNNLLDAFGSADASPAIAEIKRLNDALADPAVKKNLAEVSGLLIKATADVLQLAGAGAQLLSWLQKLTAVKWVIDIVIPTNIANVARDIVTVGDAVKGLVASDPGAEVSELTRDIAKLQAELNAKLDAGINPVALERSIRSLKAMQAELRTARVELGKQLRATDSYTTSLVDSALGMEKFSMVTAHSGQVTNGFSLIVKRTPQELKKMADAMKKAEADATKAHEAIADMSKELGFEVKQLKASALQQAINIAVQRAQEAAIKGGTTATAAEIEQITAKTAALFIQTQTIEAEAAAQEEARARSSAAQTQAAADAAKAAEDMTTASLKASEDAMKPWNDALQDMAANVDSTFVQGWNDALGGASDGFDNFVSNTWDSFKNLMANMAHLAITRPIVMQISAAMGGLTGTAGAAAGTAGATSMTGGGLSGGLSSLTSGITAAGKGLYSAIGTITNDLGLFKVSNAFNAKAVSTTGMSMAGDFAGGIAGGYLGSKVFGETSGIGATVGGIAGSALIPIPGLGAAVGSFVGTALEAGFNKLFGQKNDGSNKGYANFDMTNGSIQAGGIGKNFSQESVDAASALAEQVKNFSDLIGGSSLKANITVGGKEGIQYGGQSYGTDQGAFLKAAFKDVVAASIDLNDKLKPLILGFNGTAEELATFTTGLVALDTQAGGISDTLLTLIQNASGTAAEIIQFSQAIVSISAQAGINTVTNAIRDFTAVAPTAAVAYRDHTAELMNAINAYDGSAASASNMNNLLIENKTAAYEFATAIQTIGQQIGIMAADQAESIRQSVLTADQLRTARTTERDSLSVMLKSMTDPQEIDKASKSILDLNRKIFDSLTDKQKLSRVEEFASYAESTNAVAQGLLQGALTGLQTSQEDINTKIINMIDTAADKYQRAAEINLSASDVHHEASETFSQAVQNLVTNGITVNESRPSSEIGV